MLIVLILLLIVRFQTEPVTEHAPPRSVILAESTPAAIDLAAVERMAVSPNSKSIAWTSGDERAAALAVIFEANAKQQTLTFSTRELASFLPGGVIVDLAWSADGSMLAVELATGETDGTIVLIEPARSRAPRVVSVEDDASFALPRWGTTGHVLYFVPAGDGRPDAGGIVRYDVDDGSHRRLIDSLWVTDFTVREREITALVTDLQVTGPTHHDRFVRLDLRSGRSETIISRTTTEADDRTKGLQL